MIPELDAPRPIGDSEWGRVVLRPFIQLKPYVEEIDASFGTPVRVVHNQAAGVHLEVGPYSLGHRDIETLRAAIAACDRAAPWMDLGSP